jgi:hypothetical protein
MSIIDNTFYLSTPNDIVYLCVKLVGIHTKKIGKISHKKLGNLLLLGFFSKTCPVMYINARMLLRLVGMSYLLYLNAYLAVGGSLADA